MDERRVASVTIVAGAVGLVVGRLLFAAEIEDLWNLWASYLWVTLGSSLILLGLATWYFLRPRVGTLVATGLAAGVQFLFTLNDFWDGDPVWSRGYSAARSAGSWLITASMVAVLVGVLWSAGQHITAGAAAAWWRRPWLIVVGGVAVLSIVGGVGFVLFGDEGVPPATEMGAGEVVSMEDEWSITPDGDMAGNYIFTMIRTFGPTRDADVVGVGGRLVWPEAEIELCDVNIYATGDEFVQIGIISPTTEGCPGMLEAFVRFGLPETACLFVGSDGVNDEYCAPLQEVRSES
jgi:hypothetical protein